MKRIFCLCLALLICLAVVPVTGAAENEEECYVQLQLPPATGLLLPSVFADHMLFQQQKPIGVWGVDLPGTQVTVTMTGKNGTARTGSAAAGEDGYWRVELEAVNASYETFELLVEGSSTLAFRDILVGELFLAGGQSNMYLQTTYIIGGAALAEDNTRSRLRMLWMPADPAANGAILGQPQFSYTGCKWSTGTQKDAILNYSAVAYAFARHLYDQLNRDGAEVPVGIIDVSLGSLPIEAYLSRRCIEADPAVKDALTPGYYKAEGQIDNGNYLQMSTFYNSKLAPLSGLRLRGFLYYQAEANNWYPEQFAVLLDAMVRDWSATFGPGEPELPFISVHIAPHNCQLNDGNVYYGLPNERWAGLNDSIAKVARNHKGTFAQVPIYDILPIADATEYLHAEDPAQRVVTGGVTDHPIHPLTKWPVGDRCADVAMGLIYGSGTAYIAPTVQKVTPEGDKILVRFADVGDGLKILDDTGTLHGFSICGKDGVYVAASARIVAPDTVEVWSDFLSAPVNVRYAFTCVNVTANLGNSFGMPAVPFRWDTKTQTSDNKDWAFCDNTQVWVNTGMYCQYGSLEGLQVKLTDRVILPMTLRGSGYHDAYAGDGSFRMQEGGSDGAACVAFVYGAAESGTALFGPVLQYPSQNNDFSGLRYLAVDLANPDKREKLIGGLRVQTYDGETYLVPLTGDAALPADGEFYTFTADLHTMTDTAGAAVPDNTRAAVLQQVQTLQFIVADGQAGTVYFDNIRFGTESADRVPAHHVARPAAGADDTKVRWPLIAGACAVGAGLLAAGTWLFCKKLHKKRG